MTTINWLHLSDWHQEQAQYDREVVFDELLKDIKSRAENIDPSLQKINFVVFSGDAAFSGEPEQYRLAQERFFEPILRALELSPDKLFIVPGNHDVDRSRLDLVPPAWQDPNISRDDVNKWLSDEERREGVLKPFVAFSEFVRNFTGQEPPHYANARIFEIGDIKVGLLGLNSALLSGRNIIKIRNKDEVEDARHLVLGEPQVRHGVSLLEQANIRIVVVHHPLDWLLEHDLERVLPQLADNFQFVLHGHLHKSAVSAIQSTQSGDHIVVPGGATYTQRSVKNPLYSNSYNYASFAIGQVEGVVYFRAWDDVNTKWTPDYKVNAGSRQRADLGQHKFALPTVIRRLAIEDQPLEVARTSVSAGPENIQEGEVHNTATGRTVETQQPAERPKAFELSYLKHDATSTFTTSPFEIRSLALPLDKYLPFFKRLSDALSSTEEGLELLPRVLSSIKQATRAERAVLLRTTGGELEVVATDCTGKSEQETPTSDIIAQDFLEMVQHLDRRSQGTSHDRYCSVHLVTPAQKDVPSIIAAFGNSKEAETLILLKVNLDFEPDTMFAATIDTLLTTARRLQHRPLMPEEVEMAMYNTLKQDFGFVPDAIFQRQRHLFGYVLQYMTCWFQPTVTLSITPRIESWEALARDERTGKAPMELFSTAELWGPQFMLELDMYFLSAAITAYKTVFKRVNEMKDLSVNVYPSSLVHELYQGLIGRLKRAQLGTPFPLDKLVLEISEKAPLPQPAGTHQDPIGWFREQLTEYWTEYKIRFAIDDFGIEHSSLSRLSRIVPQIVKIDRSTLHNAYGLVVFKYFIEHGKTNPGQRVVAEGIDAASKFTLRELYDLKIDYAQGNVIAKPMKVPYDRLPKEVYKFIVDSLSYEHTS